MSISTDDPNESIDFDEIEEMVSNEEKINRESQISSENIGLSSAITQVQRTNLSLEKSLANTQEGSNQTKKLVLTVKTSNVPGPVGLLPILV